MFLRSGQCQPTHTHGIGPPHGEAKSTEHIVCGVILSLDRAPTYENQNFKYLHRIWRRYLCGRSKGTHLEIKILLRFNLGLKILVWPFEGDAFGFEDTHETEMGVEDTH